MSIGNPPSRGAPPVGGEAVIANPGSGENFTPKLVTMLREGYGPAQFKADAVSGLTVAIVALPLSMGIAIASGLGPQHGLFAAIVGGFIVSALGGSRFQIGGPAGAFIVLVASSVARNGVEGMLLATLMAGAMMLAIGWARLGSYIRYIPYPVTVGFTAGIAVIIFASQIHDLLGLTLAAPEPGEFIARMHALARAAATFNPAAAGIAALTAGIVIGLKRVRPTWPGMLVAIIVASLASVVFALPVETIGTKFGGIPRTLPLPTLPAISLDLVMKVLPDAIAFALLGSIESLLSAVVADGMTGRRHRSNGELVAQGFANIGAALFGAMPVTGTIARTATNVRAGARGPVSGMLHALFLLAFMLVAAPLADYVPLAALAGMLAVVAWNMVEKSAIASLIRSSRADAFVLAVTFLLVVFRDLTEGIVVGTALGAVLFIDRMGKTTAVRDGEIADIPDDIIVCAIDGPFFFGAAGSVAAALDRIGDAHRAYVLDCTGVPFIDATGANVIETLAHKAHRQGVKLVIAGASAAVRRTLLAHGVRPPLARFRSRVTLAVDELR